MPSGGFEFEQFKQLNKGLRSMKSGLNKFIHDFILQEAMRALRLARTKTPVDTGTLRRNWSISRVERTGNDLTVFLINTMHYASYMETGMKLRNGVWYEGFHMAELSMLEIAERMPKRFQNAFAQWVKQYGWS